MNRPASSPYRQVLSGAFDTLPAEVRAFHGGGGERRWVGTSNVRRGSGPLARLVAWLFGFPPAGAEVPTRVTVTPDAAGEIWTRDFGGHRLRSRQRAGTGGGEPLLFERFGPVDVGSALIPDGDRLRIVSRRGRAFGLPLPAWLLPSGEAFETSDRGCFAFDVTIRAPLVGLLVAYRGRLAPDPADEPRHAVASGAEPLTNRGAAP